MRNALIHAKRPPLVLPGLGAALTAPAPRALFGTVRADVTDPKALFEELRKTVVDLRDHIETELKSKAKSEDVVSKDKFDRINEAVTALQGNMDDFTAKLAALALVGGDDNVIGDLPATPKANVDAFKTFMRQGDTEVKAALSKTTDAEGAYTAPIEWDRSLMGRLKLVSRMREHAQIQSISVAGFKKLFTDRAVGSGWVGETASRPATSTPTFASLDFVPGEIYANPGITQQLLQDSALDLETWLGSEVEFEFARQEGIAFLGGDGVNKPFGILTYVTGAANAAKHPWGAIEVVSAGPPGNTTSVTGDAIIDTAYALPAEYEANAKWFMNRQSLGKIRKLKDGQGNYLWQPSFQIGQPQTLNGAPVVDLPGMPVMAANAISMLFGDMRQTYLIVDRIGISVLRDPFTNKPFIHFYTTKRVGGGVINPDAMKAVKNTAT